MRKSEAERRWKSLPHVEKELAIPKHRRDDTKLRESWNDYVDMLAKNKDISWHQAETWLHPRVIR